MTDLDTLRPEVRKALAKLRECVLRCDPQLDVDLPCTTAELLRLTSENFYQHEANAGLYARMERMERAESELAALRARIMKAPLHTVSFHIPTGITCIVCDVSMRGQRVRLVVED